MNRRVRFATMGQFVEPRRVSETGEGLTVNDIDALRKSIVGCLIGTAVGDALGLPYEGLPPGRAKRLLGAPERHRFAVGRGMVSDDTEHTCFVAQSLLESGGDVERFERCLMRRLRWWLIGLPAGVGKATARACLKMWLGCGPRRCGVFSAGNGPAMRAAILGAAVEDRSEMIGLVRASSRMTHTDPKAVQGALVVALAARRAAWGSGTDARQWFDGVCEVVGTEGAELLALVRKAVESVEAGESTAEFATSMGLGRGVTGYTLHTLPMAIHAWLASPSDYRVAVTSIIQCGGDADTTAAIVGGIVGAGVGEEGIPKEWIEGLWEWPRDVEWMRTLGIGLAGSIDDDASVTVPGVNSAVLLLRNALFLTVVLFHGFRRLAPPYS